MFNVECRLKQSNNQDAVRLALKVSTFSAQRRQENTWYIILSILIYWMYRHEIVFFAHWLASLVWRRVSSRALGCGARRGPACNHGANLGPGRAPRRVLWAFKIARAGE